MVLERIKYFIIPELFEELKALEARIEALENADEGGDDEPVDPEPVDPTDG